LLLIIFTCTRPRPGAIDDSDMISSDKQPTRKLYNSPSTR
jgi:hypothetical protein